MHHNEPAKRLRQTRAGTGVRRRSAKQSRIVAYHEAGHAVAAYILRRPAPTVSIEPKADSEGRVTTSLAPSLEGLANRSEAWVQDQIERHIVVCFAGAAAEKRYRGRANRWGEAPDRKIAVALALSRMDEKQAKPFLEWLRIRAAQLIDN